jgi:hypothetical protein
VHKEPRYRAIVTRETDEEAASHDVLNEQDALNEQDVRREQQRLLHERQDVLHELEEIEESA